jgi:SPOR domain
MSSISSTHARRVRERAAKERRKRLFLVAGLVLLAVVLAIQVPRTLGMLKSDSSSSTPSGGLTSTPGKASAGKSARRTPRFLRSAKAGDPFAARSIADGESRPGAASAPGLHDPFQPGSATPSVPTPTVALPIPLRIIVGTPGRRAPKVGWTVVLASIPTSSSRAQALRFARSARANGVRGAAVLRSSTRNRLRPGYWVVYSGDYRKLSSVERAAAAIHARGYRTAYIRQLVRY